MSMVPLKKSVAQQMSEALLVSVVYYDKGFVREASEGTADETR